MPCSARRAATGLLLSAALSASSALSIGCGSEPPAPATPAAPPDEWASLPKSAQWLHALGDFSGPRKEECAEIEKWVVGETECQASACENAKELSRDWLSRCTKLLPDSASRVKEHLTRYEERADKADSACTTELKPLLLGKCGADRTCETPAQRWVTRCASSEGSPLGVRILARFVQRRVKDHDVELDVRPCADLRAEVAGGLSCEHKFKCEEAVSRIDLYRARCEDDGDRPPLSLALAEMTLFAAAERKTEPLIATADDDAAASIRAKLPPLLADGLGVVVSVCGARVAALDAYVTARKECDKDGAIVFARAFKVGSSFDVRIGQVAPADSATFAARYPALLLAGEREIDEKERRGRFNGQLESAATEAAGSRTPLDGVRALHGVLGSFGREILRSEAMRAAITAKDASFVAAFRELGKTKARAKAAKVELASIAQRGQKYAFADLDLDGSVRFGGGSWSALFDTAVLLPQSHAAYLAELKPLIKKTAKDQPSEEVDSDQARAFGSIADECQTGAIAAKNAERALLECAFGQRQCDAAQIAAQQKALDSSRSATEVAFLTASMFQTAAVGKASDFYRKVMTTAQCEPPAW